MGLKSPSTGPIQTSLAGRRKRSRSGSPTLLVSSLPNSRRLSQATLQRIFRTMMGLVFGVYVVLTTYLMRHGHSNVFETEGRWGPSLQNNDKLLQEHISRLRKIQHDESKQRKDQHNPNLPKEPSVSSEKKGSHNDAPPARPKPKAALHDFSLEEVDIHEMKHPIEIKKSKEHPPTIAPVKQASNEKENRIKIPNDTILKAYLEPIYLEDWERKPLPIRNTTREQLKVIDYPRVNSCRRLPELWPIDDFPDDDPFLPWIHDVFPTDDGRHIQFVAQNKRRCQTGSTREQADALEKMQPQMSLFQHVPIQRVQTNDDEEMRYKLTSHEEADPDGIETRFICRFSDGQETLSNFNIHYDYAASRKRAKQVFTEEGHKDSSSIHTSQLMFRCPVPESLVDAIRKGTSVVDDRATLFVTLVPIRTPPRNGAPDRYLPPRFQDGKPYNFSVSNEWGENHILPKVGDSGRWENIPICLPTRKAYPAVTSEFPEEAAIAVENLKQSTMNTKKNRVIACTWASTSYATRGGRFPIDDGIRRLDEWIRFHLLIGMDHIFVYDNSPGENSLETVTSQFPGFVTRVRWPATICDNNRTFHDSPGELSSQYAAESSCHLRFGPHTDWLASLDIEEYIVPVGNYTSIKPFLKDLDQEGTKVISFGSWRSWPRRDLIEPPKSIHNKTICDQPHPCFTLKVPTNRSILQTYNCDRQLVNKEVVPAEKQIFRTDYVLQHFKHISTTTLYTMMTKEETKRAGMRFGKASPDPLLRFANEMTEVTMLHAKAMAMQDTAGWEKQCKGEMEGSCKIGVPYPDLNTSNTVTKDEHGWLYNCYVNPKIEEFWVPLLHEELKKSAVVDFHET